MMQKIVSTAVPIPDRLIIKGARTHNLKSVSVVLPHRSLIVFTGVSGSGKSSLAFDTIFAEGHRRSLQSVSTYARQFLGQFDKPEVDHVEGMCSAIAIDQETPARNPRSTVGTSTDAYDILRVLFSRVGIPHCPECGAQMTKGSNGTHVCAKHPSLGSPELSSRAFSFNLPFGACSACTGLGTRMDVDPALVVPNPDLSLQQGALLPFTTDRWANVHLEVIKALARQLKASAELPWKNLPQRVRTVFLDGEGIKVTMQKPGSEETFESTYQGVLRWVRRQRADAASDAARERIEAFMRDLPCDQCGGGRLNPMQLAVMIGGKNIAQVCAFPIGVCADFVRTLKLNHADTAIAEPLIGELLERLDGICSVSLDYLTLDRPVSTLSGGEAQRIRLATQIGTQLFGLLYVFDEPTTGLHPRDAEQLISSLLRLRDQGNTVLIVEHDLEVIRRAEWVVELGPGAGQHGGNIIYSGPAEGLLQNDNKSLTGAYLSGRKTIPVPFTRRVAKGYLKIKDARERNLHNLNVSIPLSCLIAITGVSGSGKSTLINQVLLKALQRRLQKRQASPGDHGSVEGMEQITKVIQIDQAPIGRTPRSNAATYTGVFDQIRSEFARTPEARKRGYKTGRFSSNVPGGRCENCTGDGTLRIPMQFLADVYVTCDACHGSGFLAETLEIRYRDRTIADVLSMSVAEALELFRGIRDIELPLRTLADVGLGFLRLGQPATTLSGGEAQRVKLATELQKKSDGHTLYLLDEPTRGLHVDDLRRLLAILNGLVDKQNTVIVIEHNVDIIRAADWIIDLGPEGGERGGHIVAEGTPEQVAANKMSYTGRYLHGNL